MSKSKRYSRWLWLIRHAKTANAADRADFDRPLLPQGKEDSVIIAERLGRYRPLEIVYTSSALRALTTAEILSQVTGANLINRANLYACSPDKLLLTIQEIGESIETAAIVAHNPSISVLANQLDPGERPAELPTLGCVGFIYNGNWCDAEIGNFTRAAELSPRNFSDSENKR